MGFICASLRTSGGDHYLTCTQAVRKASFGGRAYISLFFQLGCLSFLIPLWDVFMYIGCKSSVYIYIANTLSCFVTHLLT